MKSNNIFIDTETVVNKEFLEGIKEMVVCIICTGIIVDPYQCTVCENSFCKVCISNWTKKSISCPFKCNCNGTREGSRMVKNLLEKLTFKCPNNCSVSDIFTYQNIIKHLNSCEKIKSECPSCSSFVYKSNIKEPLEMKKLKDSLSLVKEENLKLKQSINELQEELKISKQHQNLLKKGNSINSNNLNSELNLIMSDSDSNLPFNYKNAKGEMDPSLIDKCEHFRGNYKPIFACCNKVFSCYICHNEKQNHTYEFSNKVVCLLCLNIYSGSKCNTCNTTQIFKKK